MADPDIKIDHDGFTLLRPITAICGTAPGTVTRRASVTADVFGDTYVAEFDIVPGETVTLPPPGPDETGVWRKVDGYERGPEPKVEPEEDDSPATHYYQSGWDAAIEHLTGSLATPGEQPEDTARRIRTEFAALRGALSDVRQQLLLATEAASRARDGEEEARRERMQLVNSIDRSTRLAGATEDTGTLLQRLDAVAVLASFTAKLTRERDALERLVLNPVPGGHHDGPGNSWVDVAIECGWEP